jgi:hypothetical protein
MPTVTFEVTPYEIRIAREMNGGTDGLDVKFSAYIARGGGGHGVTIYVHDDGSPIPANTHLPAYSRDTIFGPIAQVGAHPMG